VEGLKEYINDAILGYSVPTNQMKQAVCKWMKTRHNWNVKPEWLLNSSGVVPALFASVAEFTQPDEGVILFTPVYHPFYMAVEENNRALVECPLVLSEGPHYDIDFDLLEKLAADPKNTLLILCSPHNPSGRVWTKEELTRIAEIAVQHNLIVVADEIHHDLIMPGSTYTVFETISDEVAARTITCTSASKSFNLAGTQFSNIVVSNPELRTRLEKRLQARETTSCNPISFKACELAYSKGGAWLDACIKAIDDNQKLVLDFFATKHPRVKLAPITGTYLQWLDFRDLGLTPEELDQLLQFEAQVFFTDGVFFGEAAQGFKRWNLAAPRVEIEEALDRLDAVLTAHGF
ncbi:MAG: putative C-S lyase, partial [Atopobium sp.]|nr:putative C-S lyase [Atopobium sp.]